MAINENDLNQEKAYLNIVNKELKEKISDIGVSLYQQEEKINDIELNVIEVKDNTKQTLNNIIQSAKEDKSLKINNCYLIMFLSLILYPNIFAIFHHPFIFYNTLFPHLEIFLSKKRNPTPKHRISYIILL